VNFGPDHLASCRRQQAAFSRARLQPLYPLRNLLIDDLHCICQRALQVGAGGHFVAAAAKFGGDSANINVAPTSQRAANSPIS
jgi:hypothetical protein